jgi:para-nitrobenzyl esterase
MKLRHLRRAGLLAATAAVTGLAVLSQNATATATRSPTTEDAPVVVTDTGAVRGVAVGGGLAYRGLPYAAPPVGQLRWKPPQPADKWSGVRDGSQFGPSSPQPIKTVGGATGTTSEDSLYLNVSTQGTSSARRPVVVWFHGGGFVQGAGSDYEPAKLAAKGVVVVTVNSRLGALGYLAHPALAEYPGGPSGNYGLMDQQAALRWVKRNIDHFGGDPGNVTIAGQSSGGVGVLMLMTSPGSKGLFNKAIVQSGSFALNQKTHASAEASGEQFVSGLGIKDQTADALRSIPVDDLVKNFPSAAIPGYVDGRVIQRPLGESLASGQFAAVPVLQGTDHEEEAIFLRQGLAVSNGQFVYAGQVTADNYQDKIASVLGISAARAAEVAAEYPLTGYPSAAKALSTLVGDASFVTGQMKVNRWLADRVPTYLWEFNDDTAPFRYGAPLTPPVATHGSELGYLFDLPSAPVQDPLNSDQEKLADTMRTAWAKFAATGTPSTKALAWPKAGTNSRVMSLETPQSRLSTDFTQRHHVAFWLAFGPAV